MSLTELRVIGLPGIPIVTPGMDLAALIQQASLAAPLPLQAGDILVVTQKVVSKTEGHLIVLKDIIPSSLAQSFAQQWGKDPRHVEVVLQQSRRIVKMDRGVLIAETHHGFVTANAGVDQSNVPGDDRVMLLPADPDASACRLRSQLGCGAVIVSATFGRPWREGLVNVAIGVAGLAPLDDYRGARDRSGRMLGSTILAVADELAAAAGLAMPKSAGVPVALITGCACTKIDSSAQMLIREAGKDLFR